MFRLEVTQGQRDVARADLKTAQAKLEDAARALEVEKKATADALAAANAQAAANGDAAARYAAERDGLMKDLARYRGLLSKCVTPDVLIERGGRMFPAKEVH